MTNSLVLITNSENKGFGTGFVIRKERNYCYILTCSHVVEDTPKTLLVDSIKAKIIHRGSSDGLDLAILKALIDKEPLDLMESDCDDFEISGFKHFKNSDHILEPINCTLDTKVEFRPQSGESVSGWKLNIDQSDVIVGGYSGSPLICKESGKVVAVMSNRKGGRDGFAISIGHIRDIWEDMPKELVSKEVHLKQIEPKSSIEELNNDKNTPKAVKDILWLLNTMKKYPILGIFILLLFIGYQNQTWIYSKFKNYIDPKISDKKIDLNDTKVIEERQVLKGVIKYMDGGFLVKGVKIWLPNKNLEYITEEDGIYIFDIKGDVGDIIDIDFEKNDYIVCDDNDKQQRLGGERDVLLCKDY